jgi:hypothetical protein
LGDIIDPELAGWMDDGMFARWVLSDLPSPDELLATVRPYLAPSAARRLAHAVRAADAPEAPGEITFNSTDRSHHGPGGGRPGRSV